MRSIKRTTNKKKYIIILAVLAVIAFGAAVYAVQSSVPKTEGDTTQTDKPSDDSSAEDNDSLKENDVDYDTPTNEQTDAGEHTKNDAIKDEDDETEPSSADVTLNVATTSTVVRVRSIIQAIDPNGNCTLTMAKSGASTVTQMAKTQVQGSYTTCRGFDIPLSKLSAGTWQLKLVYSGKMKGEATQSVSVE